MSYQIMFFQENKQDFLFFMLFGPKSSNDKRKNRLKIQYTMIITTSA